jgi:hypothetical protein
MGLLNDAPPALPPKDSKFLRLYRSLDADDQAKLRAWYEDPQVATSAIFRELERHFDIGRSSVERGLEELRDAEWEC